MALAMALAEADASSHSGAWREILERPSQVAVVVWRGGVIEIMGKSLDADDSAPRGLPGHQQSLWPDRLNFMDEFLHRGIVGAGQQARDGREAIVAPALEFFSRLP